MGVMLFIALAGSQPWRKACPKKDKWYKMVAVGEWENFFHYHERSHKFNDDQKTILKGLLEPNPKNRWKFSDIKRCKWSNGNKISQDEAAMLLQKRKRLVDRKKFKAMKPDVNKSRKNVDMFLNVRPFEYFQPMPCLSFVTSKRPEWVLEDITDVIVGKMKGVITQEYPKKYKLHFYVTKLVDTGGYCNETKEKEYEKFPVHGTVQMWTQPGQEEILEAVAERKRGIPAIKSIAVFRAEGGCETKYLFPNVYGDILKALPADIISSEVFDEDTKEDEDVEGL